MSTELVNVAAYCHAALGEGPAWDELERCLYWVDILEGELHTLDDSGHHTKTIEAPLPAVLPSSQPGRPLVLGRDTVCQDDGAELVELARLPLPETEMRLNDA